MKFQARDSRPAVSAARSAAFDILLRVELESSYASDLLHSRPHERLSEPDHALTTELVMGVLRWRSLLDSEIAKSSAQPIAKLDLEILTALRLAVYQLLWLDRIPARAAINESVELVKRARKRSAAPFVNAVLRKLAAAIASRRESVQATGEDASAEVLAADYAHPRWLVERWIKDYGPLAAFRICQYNQSVPRTTIRLRHSDAENQLRSEGIELAAGDFLAGARRVLRGEITATAAYRSGLCVIQDEASQLVAALVGHGTQMLDCCAAPGGKTAGLADRNPTASITAVDLHTHRARLLRNLLLTKYASTAGGANVRVVAADARNLPFVHKFDRILADVPCSGTGTLAHNPEIKWKLRPDDLIDLQARQLAILRSTMAQVARAGRLIYSTCSLEREENEDVIGRALAQDSSFRVLDSRIELERLQREGELICPDLSSLMLGPYLRTLPGVHQCDGFFSAILERV